MDDRMRMYIALEHALRNDDLAAARTALGAPAEWPNVREPYTNTALLALALAWSSADTIDDLLMHGADPNYDAPDGFPSIISVLSPPRPDALRVAMSLLDHGADPNLRGVNGWTALHLATHRQDIDLMRLLLDRGADPNVATNVDDYETPLEEAERCGLDEAAAFLRSYQRGA
jgi:ankyrin repeat protein